ncbi:MAG: hypothetical protein O9284_02160 [Steroidobacteraceae bacterium]|nr:hypothetical protein [Steroidobacteraceae bacterium]
MLGLMLTDRDKQTGLRCGVADFRLRDGVAWARTLVFDTDVVRIVGRGKVSFDTEALDLEIRGQPKKPSLLRVRTPSQVEGALANPDLGVDGGRLAAQETTEQDRADRDRDGDGKRRS